MGANQRTGQGMLKLVGPGEERKRGGKAQLSQRVSHKEKRGHSLARVKTASAQQSVCLASLYSDEEGWRGEGPASGGSRIQAWLLPSPQKSSDPSPT